MNKELLDEISKLYDDERDRAEKISKALEYVNRHKNDADTKLMDLLGTKTSILIIPVKRYTLEVIAPAQRDFTHEKPETLRKNRLAGDKFTQIVRDYNNNHKEMLSLDNENLYAIILGIRDSGKDYVDFPPVSKNITLSISKMTPRISFGYFIYPNNDGSNGIHLTHIDTEYLTGREFIDIYKEGYIEEYDSFESFMLKKEVA